MITTTRSESPKVSTPANPHRLGFAGATGVELWIHIHAVQRYGVARDIAKS